MSSHRCLCNQIPLIWFVLLYKQVLFLGGLQDLGEIRTMFSAEVLSLLCWFIIDICIGYSWLGHQYGWCFILDSCCWKVKHDTTPRAPSLQTVRKRLVGWWSSPRDRYRKVYFSAKFCTIVLCAWTQIRLVHMWYLGLRFAVWKFLRHIV